MKVIALIVAGGFGKRFGDEIPKQYTSSILTQTISKFLEAKVDAVQVVIRFEDQEFYNQLTKEINLLPAVYGGLTRGESVKNGMNAIDKYNPDLVLVHDACRPFVSVNLIKEIISELKSNPQHAVVPAIAVPETVKKITNSKIEIVERDNLFLIQTPQGFYFQQLLDIYNKAEVFSTDESNLAERHQVPVIYIPGERKNIKITYKEDIMVNSEIRTGMGFDAHRFSLENSSDNHIILGGIKIPFEKKLEAHSDGDVLIHALVDALLGALGAGDIGMHFPPSDMKWKNADSTFFLKRSNHLLKEKNGHINNIDVTVICEKPRLGAYREQIRANLANILEISEDRVNIKATTTEKMGFTGRGEGIAAQAIATINFTN